MGNGKSKAAKAKEKAQEERALRYKQELERRDSIPQAFAEDIAKAMSGSETKEMVILGSSKYGYCITQEQADAIRDEWRPTRKQWKYEACVSRNVYMLLRPHVHATMSLQLKVAPLIASYLEVPDIQTHRRRNSIIKSSGRIQNAVLNVRLQKLLATPSESSVSRGEDTPSTGRTMTQEEGDEVDFDEPGDLLRVDDDLEKLTDEQLAAKIAELEELERLEEAEQTPNKQRNPRHAEDDSQLVRPAAAHQTVVASSHSGDSGVRGYTLHHDGSDTDDADDLSAQPSANEDDSAGDKESVTGADSISRDGPQNRRNGQMSPVQARKVPVGNEITVSSIGPSRASTLVRKSSGKGKGAVPASPSTDSVSTRKKAQTPLPKSQSSSSLGAGPQPRRGSVSKAIPANASSNTDVNGLTSPDDGGGTAAGSRAKVRRASTSVSYGSLKRNRGSSDLPESVASTVAAATDVQDKHRRGSLSTHTLDAPSASSKGAADAATRVRERRQSVGGITDKERQSLEAEMKRKEVTSRKQQVIAEQRARLQRITARRKRREQKQRELEELMRALMEMPCIYTSEASGNRNTKLHTRNLRWLFESLKITYREVDVSVDQEEREYMVKTSGKDDLPQVFVTDTFRGGWEEVQTANEQGVLEELLAPAKEDLKSRDGSNVGQRRRSTRLG